MWVQSLGQEDSLEEDMATHSSIPAWRIPWREEPGRLQSIASQRVKNDATKINKSSRSLVDSESITLSVIISKQDKYFG